MEFFKGKSETQTYMDCLYEYDNDPELKPLREFVKKNSYGFCDDVHYVMWRELVKSLPENFTFLEIGVYKGQMLTLVSLLNERYDKNGNVYGVTPLKNVGDKYSNYDDVDYSEQITNLFENFNLKFDINKQILNGLSTDEKIKSDILSLGMFDMVYVDGGHDYHTVVSDITLVKKIVKEGGYIITDDSSCYKNFGYMNVFRGHKEVCDAVRDTLENDNNFSEVACVGHNRVFQKK